MSRTKPAEPVSEVRAVTIPVSRAAEMFHLNLGVWKDNDYVQRSCEQSELDEISDELATIASGSGDAGPVQWGLRHIVMERL